MKHSPLEDFIFPPGLCEVPFLAQIDLRADPSDAALMTRLASALGVDLPVRPNTVHSRPDGCVLWLGPDEWLAIGEPGTEDDLAVRCRSALAAGTGAVVDVSANRTTIEISGAQARDVLESGCAIDLHPRAFGPGRCAQTMVARAGVVLHQLTTDPRYRLHVRPSFARYLATWLSDALGGTTAAVTKGL